MRSIVLMSMSISYGLWPGFRPAAGRAPMQAKRPESSLQRGLSHSSLSLQEARNLHHPPRPQPGSSAPPDGCGPARGSHERASPDGKKGPGSTATSWTTGPYARFDVPSGPGAGALQHQEHPHRPSRGWSKGRRRARRGKPRRRKPPASRVPPCQQAPSPHHQTPPPRRYLPPRPYLQPLRGGMRVPWARRQPMTRGGPPPGLPGRPPAGDQAPSALPGSGPERGAGRQHHPDLRPPGGR
jgi:hypothetical protein